MATTMLSISKENCQRLFIDASYVDNGCFIWKRACVNGEYPSFSFRGKGVLVHRFVAAAFAGLSLEDIKRYVVMHTCDVTQCINPDHLIIATQSANLKDAYNKGRRDQSNYSYSNRIGQTNNNAKLTNKQVAEVRQEHIDNPFISIVRLAKKYNVCRTTMSRILHGQARING